MPRDLDELRAVVLEARRSGQWVSIAGGLHSMGGQAFARGSVLIDTRALDQARDLDRSSGRVTVQGGIQWPALLSFLETAQRGEAHPWGICQKQTGADRLTLGGALSCNAHGRGLSLPPLVDQVERFDIMGPDGEVQRCSRTENPQLFSLAIGGYGLFGIITEVVVRLRPRCKMRRVVAMADTAGLMELMADRVREGFEYGDFQFAIDAEGSTFLNLGVLSCYAPVSPDTPLTENPIHFSHQDWLSLAIDAHRDKRRAFALYASGYLRTSGQVYWSDAQLSGPYLEDYHDHVHGALPGGAKGSEMITELFVPRSRFEAFMADARRVLRERSGDVIYGTVRLIEAERETFLSWAREPWACVVLNLHVEHTRAAVAAAGATFRALIDAAIRQGGSYYLTYHRWACRDQVLRCYPQMRAFLAEKRRHDPTELFQSEWYRGLRDLLGYGR